MFFRMNQTPTDTRSPAQPQIPNEPDAVSEDAVVKKEYGGPKGLEPTRYGDWERNGRCSDF